MRCRPPVTRVATAFPVADCSGDILGRQIVVDQGYGVVLDSRLQTLTQSLSDRVVTVGTSRGSCSFSLTTDLIRTALLASIGPLCVR